MTPAAQSGVAEQMDVLRRIADRGISYGLKEKLTHVVDPFQHTQDELQRLKTLIEGTQ